MKICAKCILPETFPGINFDNRGVCNFCRDFKGEQALRIEKEEYYRKFLDLIQQIKEKATTIAPCHIREVKTVPIRFIYSKRYLN